MRNDEFTDIFHKQVIRSEDVLVTKAAEYATEDRLHNFKVAAALRGVTTREALAGMMVKHTVSLYDMCESDQDYPKEVWDEKITDHINYLILLQAIVTEPRTNTEQGIIDFPRESFFPSSESNHDPRHV